MDINELIQKLDFNEKDKEFIDKQIIKKGNYLEQLIHKDLDVLCFNKNMTDTVLCNCGRYFIVKYRMRHEQSKFHKTACNIK